MLKRLIFVSLIVLIFIPACSPAGSQSSTQSLTKVSLPMGYIPNIQFAPFYVALDKGYYRDAGFDVEFDYAFETDGVALVGANKLPFALVSGEQVLLGRAQELPIVYVMGWYQQYPITVISRPELNIKTPADLKGKKIGLPGFFGANYVGLRALLRAGGLTEKDVTLEAINFTQVESYAAGQQDVVVVYVANEPIQLTEKGYAYNSLRVSDYAEHASNGLITNEAMIKDHPDQVRAFVAATLKGIRDTINNPDEAYTISKKYIPNLTDADAPIQKKILAASIEQWNTKTPGYSDPAAWDNMQAVLLDMGSITAPLDLNKAFSNDFIK
jgi:NitT/TauT family transport system substrate-binding protein